MIKLVVNDEGTIEIDADNFRDDEEIYTLSMTLIEAYLKAVLESESIQNKELMNGAIKKGLTLMADRINIEEERPRWEIIKGGKN